MSLVSNIKKSDIFAFLETPIESKKLFELLKLSIVSVVLDQYPVTRLTFCEFVAFIITGMLNNIIVMIDKLVAQIFFPIGILETVNINSKMKGK